MKLTLQILQQIAPGEIFKIVTTKLQTVHNPMVAELTFICVRGGRHEPPDWAIYCHHSYQTVDYILDQGDKVTFAGNIQAICPCDEEAFKLYRI